MTTSISGFGLAQQSATYTTPPVEEGIRVPPLWLYPNMANTAAAAILILVANSLGRVLGELQADIAGVAWKLNGYGQTRLTLARAATDEELVRPGNRLAVLFDNGLPAWGGVIDMPRPWRGATFELVAYSAEYLLTWRRTADRQTLKGTAGGVLRMLLSAAQPDGPLGFGVGAVWDGGVSREWELGEQTLFDSLANITHTAGDFYTETVLQRGKLDFVLHFVERRGVDRGRAVTLEEGANLVEPSLNEQGPILNQWRVSGARGLGGNVQHVGTARDQDSILLYGLRQEGETDSSLTTQALADMQAEIRLRANSMPHSIVGMDALDRSPGRFAEYDVGDTVWVELHSQGYGGFAGARRLTAREYLATGNVSRLVVD